MGIRIVLGAAILVFAFIIYLSWWYQDDLGNPSKRQ